MSKQSFGQWSPNHVRIGPAVTALTVNVKLSGEAWGQNSAMSYLRYLEKAFDHISGWENCVSLVVVLYSLKTKMWGFFPEWLLAMPESFLSFPRAQSGWNYYHPSPVSSFLLWAFLQQGWHVPQFVTCLCFHFRTRRLSHVDEGTGNWQSHFGK